MTLTVTQTLVTIAAIAIGVQISRWLPFAAFSGKKELPEFIKYYASRGLGDVYKRQYAWKENFLISVGGGTAVYMILVQFVF